MMKRRQRNSIHYRLGRHIRRTKCMLLNRRGDGVHSPFAFRFIRQVLRNPHPYTAFEPLAGLHQERKKQLQKATGHQAIVRKRFLEIIFRLAVDYATNRISLWGAKDSLVSAYLSEALPLALIEHRSTGIQAVDTHEICAARLIVLEDVLPNDLKQILQILRDKTKTEEVQILVLNTYNPSLRAGIKTVQGKFKADVQFDLKGLEIWVWRKGLTPGCYSVYC